MKNPKQVKSKFDNEVKSNIVFIEGQSFHTSHVQLPNNEKSNLNLMHRYIILQIYVLKEKSFHIELRLRDSKQQKQRLIFSTHFKDVHKNTMHTQLPLGDFFLGNCWIHATFDLVDLCENILKCKYHCLDTIIIGPTCRIRKIFTMKMSPYDDMIPKSVLLPPSAMLIPEVIMINASCFNGELPVLSSSGEVEMEERDERQPPKTASAFTTKKTVVTPSLNRPSSIKQAPKTANPITRARSHSSTKVNTPKQVDVLPQKITESIRYSQTSMGDSNDQFDEQDDQCPIVLEKFVLPSNDDYDPDVYVNKVTSPVQVEEVLDDDGDDEPRVSVSKRVFRVNKSPTSPIMVDQVNKSKRISFDKSTVPPTYEKRSSSDNLIVKRTSVEKSSNDASRSSHAKNKQSITIDRSLIKTRTGSMHDSLDKEDRPLLETEASNSSSRGFNVNKSTQPIGRRTPSMKGSFNINMLQLDDEPRSSVCNDSVNLVHMNHHDGSTLSNSFLVDPFHRVQSSKIHPDF
ncbi:hypothetical protein AKO1_008173, partial [Acrasis kona]